MFLLVFSVIDRLVKIFTCFMNCINKHVVLFLEMEAAGDDHWQQGDTDQEPLPTTCTVLEKNAEKEVYVIGTAHFSRESQEDVAKVARSIPLDAGKMRFELFQQSGK